MIVNIKILLKILGTILGLVLLPYKLINFLFVNMNRSSNDPANYIYHDLADLLTIVVIVLFTASCLRGIVRIRKKIA